jgi:hypothetical protein
MWHKTNPAPFLSVGGVLDWQAESWKQGSRKAKLNRSLTGCPGGQVRH